jgi:hypothetical protein
MSACTDVVEDLERAYKSLPEENLRRTTKILQATQHGVRETATDPLDRRISRRNRPSKLAVVKSVEEPTGISTFLQGLGNHLHPRVPPERLSQNTQSTQNVGHISDAQSLHKHIDFLLTQVPLESIVQAVQNVGKLPLPLPRTVTRSSHGPKTIGPDLDKVAENLGDRVRALEAHTQIKSSHRASDGVKKEEGSLQTKESSHSNKRPVAELEDERASKRSRS